MQPNLLVNEAKRPSRRLLVLDEATEPARCGHKAASLAALRGLGFDIPDAFVIPVGTSPTRAEVAASLERLGGGPVAVRSSGVAEDLGDASFAGQYDTVLDVRGPDAVLEAAERCVASASDERVLAYGGGGSPMAVLVQRMVAADVAGVAFSANPLTGDRAEVRVSATRGLGDKLVSGEVNADEWSVRDGVASPIAQPQRVIEPSLALRIAELARRCEAARGTPQDIEWALTGDRLVLLQSRPITLLPVAPQIEIPKGTWQKDAAHFPEPIAPFAASTHLLDEGQFFEPVAAWGMLPDGLTIRTIGHEVYTHVEPDDDGKDPPPWWLIAIAARLVPSLRRKLATSARAIEAGWLRSVPTAWNDSQRAQQRARIEQLAAIDLSVFGDDGLFAHMGELRAFCVESMKLHFKLFVPYTVGVHELVQACQELLSWDTSRAMRLLQGLSSPSAAPTRELAAIARRVRDRPGARAVVEARRADLVARLDEADPTLAEELRGYLLFWGLRPFGSEAGRRALRSALSSSRTCLRIWWRMTRSRTSRRRGRPQSMRRASSFRGRPSCASMLHSPTGALVTDAGSVLSHTAIVAREYGLPAVVATSNATSMLEDGEELLVDGNRGTVERLGVATSAR